MEFQRRKRTRLKDYDYSQNGVYFITICTKNRENIFLQNYKMENDTIHIEYTQLGEIAKKKITYICEKYDVILENFVVMPDHIHLLLGILNNEYRLTARVNPTISQIVGAYKSLISVEYLKYCKENNLYMGDIWQASFFDHIIRDDADYLIKYNYINENPLKWILKRSPENALEDEIMAIKKLMLIF